MSGSIDSTLRLLDLADEGRFPLKGHVRRLDNQDESRERRPLWASEADAVPAAENPEVRQAVYQLMRWWLERGIDGFRMDVINTSPGPLRFKPKNG